MGYKTPSWISCQMSEHRDTHHINFEPALCILFLSVTLCSPVFRNTCDNFSFPDLPVSSTKCPSEMDWSPYFPHFFEEPKKKPPIGECTDVHANINKPQVEFVDVGCGYGGLLVTLSPMFPTTLMLGMEIRVKVSDFVKQRIKALRCQNPGKYQNIACIRTNAMKYLCNFFHKGQLTKLFFLFPDPHFKKQKHKWRIISSQLLAEYAYILKVGGRFYTMTDVMELHSWIVKHLDEHPLFERMDEQQLADDVVVKELYDSSEEAKKVTRSNGNKYLAVYSRIEDPYVKSI